MFDRTIGDVMINSIKNSEVFCKENLYEEFLRLCDFSKPVVLYGVGAGVVWYIKLLERKGIIISCLCDSSVNEKNKHYSWKDEKGKEHRYPLCSLQEIYLKYGKCNFVISAPRHRESIKKIIQQIPHEKIYVFDAAPIVIQNREPSVYKEYFKSNVVLFEKVFLSMTDDLSKKTMKNCIYGYVTSNCDYFMNTASDSQYFPDIIKEILSDKEVFVDVGAYDGDSLEEFINSVNEKFKKVIAFEPDIYNYGIGKNKFQDERIFFYPYGCSENEESAYIIHENGDNADEGAYVQREVNEIIGNKIQLIKLDDFIKEEVTYIKMDIEGMELTALKGSRNIIKKYKPKLAISIYHKMEDMVEIIEYIRSLNSTYKFYMRHFWDCNGTDVILFAI